jgi:hypothetical protein
MARTRNKPASPPVSGDAGAEVADEPVQVISRAAAIDVAKGSGMVWLRLPHESRAGRRTQKVWEVTATFAAVVALMDHLVCQGVERLVLESASDYWRIWLRRRAWRCGWSMPATSSTCRAGPSPAGWTACGCAS